MPQRARIFIAGISSQDSIGEKNLTMQIAHELNESTFLNAGDAEALTEVRKGGFSSASFARNSVSSAFKKPLLTTHQKFSHKLYRPRFTKQGSGKASGYDNERHKPAPQVNPAPKAGNNRYSPG